MLIEQIISSKVVNLYLLDLINMEYINLNKSYIMSSGVALFNIDTDKLPELTIENETINPREVLESTLFDLVYNYQYATDRVFCAALGKETECIRKIFPDKTDEYYIPFVVSPTYKMKHVTTFVVGHKGNMRATVDEEITNRMDWLKSHFNNEYKKYEKKIQKFVKESKEWVCEQIRKKLFDGKVDGEFQRDLIKDNVYFNRRIAGNKSVTYIINDWFTHYAKGFVKWIDIDNGDGLMYAALNDYK